MVNLNVASLLVRSRRNKKQRKKILLQFFRETEVKFLNQKLVHLFFIITTFNFIERESNKMETWNIVKAFGKGNGDDVPKESHVNNENVKNNAIVPSSIGFLTSNETVITEDSTVASGGLMTSSASVCEISANISALADQRHQELTTKQEKMLSNQDTMKENLNEVKEGQQALLTILASPNPKKAAAAALAKRTPLPKSTRKNKLPTTSSKKPVRGSSRHQERFTSAAKEKAETIKPAF